MGLLGEWYTTVGGSFVQVLGTNFFVLCRQLAFSETEPTEGVGKVGKAGEDFGKGDIR